jgi:hypothetical protein
MQLFFCECICEGAIDFAEVRMRICGVAEQMVERNAARSSARQALHLSLNFLANFRF